MKGNNTLKELFMSFIKKETKKMYLKKDLKKFLLQKHFLLNPRRISGISGIEFVMSSLRAVQYDPQNPCGRNIDIFLQARIKGIFPSSYYQWIYEDRKGVETWDKELCVIPIEDLSICRGRFTASRIKKLSSFREKYKKELNETFRFVKKNGPVCSSAIKDKISKKALDVLCKNGEIVISNRKNGIKYYDLASKVYGGAFKWNGDTEINKEQIIRRIKSVGVLSYSGVGSGWLSIGTSKEITPILDELIKCGKVCKIKIKDTNQVYVINSDDLELLNNASKLSFSKKMSFLPPLDNLLWDREMIKDIFGFTYKWEAYTPDKDRKYGHYVLPILYGLDFIGRIEPKIDSVSKVLKIKGLWMEEGFQWNDTSKLKFETYLRYFKKYIGAKEIKWLCRKY